MWHGKDKTNKMAQYNMFRRSGNVYVAAFR